jgi:hypothetical protein
VKRRVRPPHPFPARMAPEVAIETLDAEEMEATVLDPMCGSGTVLRAAAQRGRHAIGFDLDPLAVLMARVWTTPIDQEILIIEANRLVRQATTLTTTKVELPWIDNDSETKEFVSYWFTEPQRGDLRRIALLLNERSGPMADALRLALSRLIITKDSGASLARDVAHSRPHRTKTVNSFDVFSEFAKSAAVIAGRLDCGSLSGSANVRLGDSRRMTSMPDQTISLVLTSPPYLNAIDYMRGHRMSLVWLGYGLEELRSIRAHSIGTERGTDSGSASVGANLVATAVPEAHSLPLRFKNMFQRFADDMSTVASEISRVLIPHGRAVFVVGNSMVRGVFLANANLVAAAAEKADLVVEKRTERELPSSNRYLPPPSHGSGHALGKRMRSETVLICRKRAESS